jgi:hypothetical protein
VLKIGMLTTKTQSSQKAVSAGGFTYAQVEAALARVFKVDAADQANWLRGRIQHLRRLKLTPPAGGGPVSYDFLWAARWLVALRLELLGLNPKDVVEFFAENWERKPGRKFPVKSLREIIEEARKPASEGRYRTDDVFLTVTRANFHDFPRIGLTRPYHKPHSKYDAAKGLFDYSREHMLDVVAIPLTELLRALEAALNGEDQS